MSSNVKGFRSYKVDFNGQKKRGRLNTPLRLSELHKKLHLSFSINAEYDLSIQYKDEEGDVITVSTDEDLEMAEIVFSDMGKKVMIFAIQALKKPAMPAGMFAQMPTDSITVPAKQICPDQEKVSNNKLTHSFSQLFANSIIVYPNSNACSRALCFPR